MTTHPGCVNVGVRPARGPHSPVWPCNFCTISLVCRFQMYTRLSSEPDTIHWEQEDGRGKPGQSRLVSRRPSPRTSTPAHTRPDAPSPRTAREAALGHQSPLGPKSFLESPLSRSHVRFCRTPPPTQVTSQRGQRVNRVPGWAAEPRGDNAAPSAAARERTTNPVTGTLLWAQRNAPGTQANRRWGHRSEGTAGGARSSLACRKPTFPPVTEKLAKMQYFSFLWPVYVFRHCKGKGSGVSMESPFPCTVDGSGRLESRHFTAD